MLDITVTNPGKVGDGMGAYIAYEVITRTTMPSFKSPDNSVKRRFSDFLGLSQKISEKYMQKGRIVPPAPEKSVVGEDWGEGWGGGEGEGGGRRGGGGGEGEEGGVEDVGVGKVK